MNEDDIFSEMSIADAATVEGNEGNTSLEFTVSLSEAVEEEVTVDFGTVDDSAVAGEDYLTSEGSLTFAPGETSQTINVDIVGDTAVEEDETFFVEIRNAEGVAIADMEAIGTITDDDSAETTSDVTADLSVDVTSIPEGNDGETSTVTYTVTLSEPAEQDARVIVDSTGGNNPLVNEPLDILTGQQSVTFTNEVSGDNIPEENETLTGTLSFAAFNAPDGSTGEEIAIGQPTANVTVIDDDGDDSAETTSDITADLSVDVTSIPEGNDGDTSLITYTVTLSEPVPDQSVRGIINFQTSGTENGELIFDDGADTGLDIVPGETTGTFTYEFPGDNLEEPDETVTASLDFVGLMDDGSGNGRNEVFNLGQSSVSTTIQDDDGEDGSTDPDTGTDPGSEDGSTDPDTGIDPGSEDGSTDPNTSTDDDGGTTSGDESTENMGVNITADVDVIAEGDEGETTTITYTVDLGQTIDRNARLAVDLRDGDGNIETNRIEIPAGEQTFTITDEITGDNEAERSEIFSATIENTNIIDGGNGETLDLARDVNRGTASVVVFDDDGGNDIVYRFFNPTAGVHFYTGNVVERDFVEEELDNYEFEGPSYRTVDPMTGGAEDVYRFFNSRTGVHLYTTDENERDNIIENLDEFAFEGTAFNAYETEVEGSIPIYRFFEPTIGVHFYTPNEAERDFVDAELDNYNSEGIAYYALPLETEDL